jgi:hypothetical protein
VSDSPDDLTPDAAKPSAAPRRAPSFLVGLVAGVLFVALAYGAATMAYPETVPRLASLPRPPTRVSSYGTCHGEPYGKTVVTWERSGSFWKSAGFTQAGVCIN